MWSRRMVNPRVARAVIAASLVAALVCGAATSARAADDLYRAQTIVTGQGEANRIIGFAACLEDVLIKVSGDLRLGGDPRLAGYKSHAADAVKAYRYHDRMSGTPVRDEQGTRDRPYDLIVDFEASRIDGILHDLGITPWLADRPVLGVVVQMEQGGRKYLVTADGRQSDLQRDALFAAAAKRGIRIVLPDAAALAKSNIDAAEPTALAPPTLISLVAAQGANVVLAGHLTWSDSDLGWVTEWRVDWQGRPHRWRLGGITFDEAFRRGLGGAAQILSGHGDPG
jgi:uncharacterized protein